MLQRLGIHCHLLILLSRRELLLVIRHLRLEVLILSRRNILRWKPLRWYILWLRLLKLVYIQPLLLLLPHNSFPGQLVLLLLLLLLSLQLLVQLLLLNYVLLLLVVQLLLLLLLLALLVDLQLYMLLLSMLVL